MANKVIGYQITNANQGIPNGLFSFQIFKTAKEAYIYAKNHNLNGLCDDGWFVQQIREGDIENPTYISTK